jgi:hypothetical protein
LQGWKTKLTYHYIGTSAPRNKWIGTIFV